MLQVDEQLQDLSNRALRRGVLLFAIFAVPTVLASVLRAMNGEWRPLFTLQLVALILVLALAALRHRVPQLLLGTVLLVICVLAAWSGLYTYGVVASAGHWLVAVAIFLSGMLFKLRGMIVATAIMFSGMLLIAFAQISGAVVPAVPPAVFLGMPATWLVEFMSVLLFMGIVLPTLNSFMGALRNLVSEVEEGRDKIAYLAEHDELTELPRLSVVRDRLDSACRRSDNAAGVPVAMFVDLDGFKALNDSYGHEAGDSCLRAVSARLSGRLRGQDTAARIGGDEFIVLLETVSSKDDAARLAAELLELIKQPIEFEGQILQVGASIGVALYPENGSSAEGLLQSADKAMYRSKRAGSNGFAFADVVQAAARKDARAEPATDDELQAAPAGEGRAQAGLMDQWLDAIATRCIVVVVTILSFAVAGNSWRIITNQAAPNIIPTVVALLLAMALFLGRRRVSLRTKMALTSSVGLLIALPGLFLSGLAGPGIGWSLAASLFLVGIFYGWRASLAVAAVVLLAVVLAGVGFTTGRLSHGFDVTQGTLHPATWLVFLLAATAFTGIVLSSWHLHKKTFKRLMDEISAQIADLMLLATHDQVTGLPARRLADDRLEMACSRARRTGTRAAVMLLDLDGFKAINDRLGHDAGDQALREIAARMASSVQASDTVARIGGDEFLLIVEAGAGQEVLLKTAQQLLAAIAEPMQLGAGTCAVTASVGIAVFPDHGTEPATLRQKADAAMYAAKLSGKNAAQFAQADD